MADEHDELPELEPDMAAFVAAYEAETARDEVQIEAALEQVTAKIGAGAGATGAGLSMTAKVGIVGALIGVVGVIGLQSRDSEPQPVPVVAAAPEQDAPEVDVPVRPEPTIAEGPIEEPSVEPEGQEESEEREEPEAAPDEPKRTPAKKRPTPKDPEPEDDDDSLMAELGLLQRTRKALRSGRPEEALEAAAQHRREFPNGRLAEERDATEVSALCALGRGDEARRKAAAFERAHPDADRDLLGDCE